ncbi:hypothetical protein M426DRAFT_26764 [Hypoxylon sp. CI-4A]|nr:hypothetical protein M426DRAFT_26764 [Hypoxylon sp. CI-4A]
MRKCIPTLPTIFEAHEPSYLDKIYSIEKVNEEEHDECLFEDLDGEATSSSASSTSENTSGCPSPTFYEVPQEIYEAILAYKMAQQGVTVPKANAAFFTPVWYGGHIVQINDPTTQSSGQVFNYINYLRALRVQFYRNKRWFRCMVDAFWGAKVHSISQTLLHDRPFIKIVFYRHSNIMNDKEGFVRDVEAFAYIMGLYLPINGLGPITDIFGFCFVNHAGFLLSAFETVERVGAHGGQDDYDDTTDQLLVQHYVVPGIKKIVFLEEDSDSSSI